MTKFLSILLAFQVLLSSMSFNIGLHFCEEELQSLALFSRATPCEHALADHEDAPACPFHKKSNQEKEKNCCDDQQVIVEGQEHETTLSSFSPDLHPNFDFITAFALNLSENLFSTTGVNHKYHNYKPPLIRIDIPVLIQSFLI